jgi:hypothetical protein
MNSGNKSADILVIADQERLHALFEPGGDPAVARVRKAFTIDDGMKSAAAEAPSLLFFQGRMGGLSAEIIARHIRLELKDRKTKMVMFYAPEDIPDGGIKFLYATIDSSLPDGQLAEQVRSVVASFASGGKKALSGINKGSATKTASGEGKKPCSDQITVEAVQPAKQTVTLSVENSRRESPVTGRAVSVSAENTEDIVSILSREILPHDTGEVISSPTTDAAFAANFRDTLECLLVKAAGKNPATPPSRAEQVSTDINPELSGPRNQQSLQPVGAGISRGAKVRTIVIAVSVLSLAGLIFMFSGLHPSVEKAGNFHSATGGKAPLDVRPGLPSGPEVNTSGKIVENPRPAPAKKQMHEGYISYKVRRGDTILNILSARFGLSERNAAEILPEILEVNGIKGSTVLEIGQTIFIPESMKLQIKQ